MLKVIGDHYAQCGQTQDAAAMIQIAQTVLEAFQSDIPYRFPANDAPTQTYAMFQPERRQLSELAALYSA